MRRREFLGVLGGAAAWPLVARAQERLRRIGMLVNLDESDPEGHTRVGAFREALGKLGWTEGRDIQIEFRSYAGSPERARSYAIELTALKPDVIFAAPSSALAALQRETRDVPIVFAQVGDPVSSGFVDSLARPGGNITGFATTEFAIGAKWIELLKQIAPSVTRVLVFYDPLNPTAAGYLPPIEAGARRFDVRVSTSPVRDTGEIERTVEAFTREPGGGVIPLASPLVLVQRDLIISLTKRYLLPSVFAFRAFPTSGVLLPTVQTISTPIGGQRDMSIAFSGASKPPTCRSSCRPSLSWSSTSRPPRRSASPCRQRYSPGPTRSSNENSQSHYNCHRNCGVPARNNTGTGDEAVL